MSYIYALEDNVETVGQNRVYLAGSPYLTALQFAPVFDHQFQVQSMKQRHMGSGWANAKPRDFGNVLHVRSFATVRTFATRAEAVAWMDALGEQRREGRLVRLMQQVGTYVWSKSTAAYCTATIIGGRDLNVAMQVRYQIEFSALSAGEDETHGPSLTTEAGDTLTTEGGDTIVSE